MTLRVSKAAMYAPQHAPDLHADAHKGDAGRLLCVCGSADMPGAAVLVARAAQRAGAGLVTVACTTEELRIVVPVAAPEAILVDASDDRCPDVAGWRELLSARSDHARVAGPGLGNHSRTRHLVTALLDDAFTGPLVLDADGLNVIGTELESLRRRRGPLVLTPHPGEATRLLGTPIPSDPAGRLRAARDISTRANAICCLKGNQTVVADGERVYVNTTGNPGMATAGAGDVLCGILGAYLAGCVARPVPQWGIFDAVAAAVHVHGLAGDLSAQKHGQRGTIASDLIEHLPEAQMTFARSSQKK